MEYTLFFLWSIRTIKELLFFVYLWQLKEYRLDRIRAHLTTLEGKRQIFSPLLIVKLFFFIFALFIFMALINASNLNEFFLPVLLALYLAEVGFIFYQKINLGLRRPKFTAKATLLFVGGLILALFLLGLSYLELPRNFFVLSFLVLDLLLFSLVSLLVLVLKPVTYLLRQRIIQKAKKKIEKFPELLVIGITGSYGKTSTKEFLARILSSKYSVLKTPGSHNTDIGIAKVVLSALSQKHEVFVVETGAYKKREIRRICEIVKPKIGVLTSVNEQHLALFGGIKNTCKAKFELIEALSSDGLAVFNGDDEHCLQLAKKAKTKVKFYSLKKKMDVSVRNIRVKKDGLEFEVQAKGETVKFKTELLGRQNIPNILAASVVAVNLGLSLEGISRTVAQIKPFEKTMKPYLGTKGATIIDDSFSSNSFGFLAALEYLKVYQDSRKFLITPGIIELGKASAKIHKELGEKSAKVCHKVFLTSPNFAKDFKEGAEKVGGQEKILVEENPRELVKKLVGIIKKGDAVLLEGKVPILIKKFLISNVYHEPD